MAPNSGHRIFAFQGVPPCQDADPAALLAVLIEIAGRASRRHVRDVNARELARQAGVLLALFEDIRDRYPQKRPPPACALSLSELYLVLRKLDWFLEEYATAAGSGGRLWLLMNAERVATELRILARDVATALDVLPMRRLDIEAEVKELVWLVKKQARQAAMTVDPADSWAAREVAAVLRGFERKIAPDSGCLRRILDCLEITSWDRCNEGIRFLEEELELLKASGKEREKELTEALIGLLLYCRCVLFDSTKRSREGHVAGCKDDSKEAVALMNIEDFRCPISLELMSDPVTLETGQTYDRASILEWFKAGNFTCPKTGKKIGTSNLIPNIVLRSLIEQFCRLKGIPFNGADSHRRSPGAAPLESSITAMEARRMIFEVLVDRLTTATPAEKGNSAFEIRLLTKFSVLDRARLAEGDAIPALIDLLYSTNPITQENAAAALLNLSKHAACRSRIVEEGGLRPILRVVRSGYRMEARQTAAAAVFYLSSIDEYRRIIGEMPGAIPALVDLLKCGNSRGKKNAAVAIFALLLLPENYQQVLDAGAVPCLVDLLSSERNDLVNDSLAVIARLAEQPEGTVAILEASIVPMLASFLHSYASPAAKEFCVSTLLSLCINGGDHVVSALSKTPSLMASLYTLLSGGTSRASKKASSLLKILHNYYCLHSGDQNGPVHGEYIVRVQ
ncbi:U-box domain-containing protein 19 [Nymphaea thermarum]|nr:U-box domain-containing protein 19 [Nymphaea thermarum]